MKTKIKSKADRIAETVGVYYNDDKTQKIGYKKDGEFVAVCTIDINAPFQSHIVAAIRTAVLIQERDIIRQQRSERGW